MKKFLILFTIIVYILCQLPVMAVDVSDDVSEFNVYEFDEELNIYKDSIIKLCRKLSFHVQENRPRKKYK